MELARQHIQNSLRRQRKLMGYSQSDVAKFLGMKRTNRISEWERGDAMPNLINLLKLSIVYRTLPTDLYFDLFQELKIGMCLIEDHSFSNEEKQTPNDTS
jgi:transcriptional regulator with XRE-family HTH domain